MDTPIIKVAMLERNLCIVIQKTNNETLIAMKNMAVRILLTVHAYKTRRTNYNTCNTIF